MFYKLNKLCGRFQENLKSITTHGPLPRLQVRLSTIYGRGGGRKCFCILMSLYSEYNYLIQGKIWQRQNLQTTHIIVFLYFYMCFILRSSSENHLYYYAKMLLMGVTVWPQKTVHDDLIKWFNISPRWDEILSRALANKNMYSRFNI